MIQLCNLVISFSYCYQTFNMLSIFVYIKIISHFVLNQFILFVNSSTLTHTLPTNDIHHPTPPLDKRPPPPNKPLRSDNRISLVGHRHKTVGRHQLETAAATLWNDLSSDIRNTVTFWICKN